MIDQSRIHVQLSKRFKLEEEFPVVYDEGAHKPVATIGRVSDRAILYKEFFNRYLPKKKI
jgi:hypothetical protein